MAELPQFFGVVPTGSPLITVPSAAPAQNSLVYNLPPTKFNHLTVFMLPNVALPPNTAAAVYIASTPQGGNAPDFKFLGGIGPGKESAVYKVGGGLGGGGMGNNAQIPEVDMDAPESGAAPSLILGISIEDAATVTQKMAALASSPTNTANSTAMVKTGAGANQNQALIMAQRIIKNAFNFLASFSGNVPVPGAPGAAGVEVVPLKAFEEWWKKFESKVRNDPSFLERDVD